MSFSGPRGWGRTTRQGDRSWDDSINPYYRDWRKTLTFNFSSNSFHTEEYTHTHTHRSLHILCWTTSVYFMIKKKKQILLKFTLCAAGENSATVNLVHRHSQLFFPSCEFWVNNTQNHWCVTALFYNWAVKGSLHASFHIDTKIIQRRSSMRHSNRVTEQCSLAHQYYDIKYQEYLQLRFLVHSPSLSRSLSLQTN